MPSGSRSVAILPATADSPERRTPSICASSPLGARSTESTSSRRGTRTSSALAATSRSAAGPARRRLCAIAGFYRYAVEEELLDHSAAVHVRRPRLDYESHVTGLDRNELGALLVTAGIGPAVEHALISFLGWLVNEDGVRERLDTTLSFACVTQGRTFLPPPGGGVGAPAGTTRHQARLRVCRALRKVLRSLRSPSGVVREQVALAGSDRGDYRLHPVFVCV